ncbi:MAG: hypothetical protein LCI03_04775 [Actinobacteria bacterium]|nr:hypothetical protein [Actinomycetota bacterium]
MFSPEFVTGASAHAGRLRIGLRLNWFRPLPLSCIEHLEVTDSVGPLDAGVLSLDGHDYPVDALASHDDVWWHTLSDAWLALPWEDRAGPLRVTIRTRIPLLVDHTGSAVAVLDSALVEVEA